MKIILLLCFAGVAFGLQPALKYRYFYMGLTETGIAAINTDRAGTSISLFADVEVQENGHAVIQFDNIKVGERLGKKEKHEFTAITDRRVRKALETPFESNLFGNEEYSMLVETEDVLWLRNIRRGVVGLFRNSLLKANFDQSHIEYIKDDIPKIFSVQEETILGTCEVQYSVHKLEGIMSDTFSTDKNIEIDVQLENSKSAPLKTQKKSHKKYYAKKSHSKSSKHKYSRYQGVPELVDDLYHVTRTVNLDNCQHNVFIRLASGGFDFKAGSSTYSWYGARTSVYEYVFRGSGGAFRMESAQSRGNIIAKALGVADEEMHTSTTQTLILKSVEEITNPRRVSPSVEIYGWMQEFLSPFKEPTVSQKVPWVTYTGVESLIDPIEMVTGLKTTRTEIAARKQHLIACVKTAAQAFAAERASEEIVPEDVIELLTTSSDIIQTLPKETIMEVLDEIIVKDSIRPHEIFEQKILIDSLVASGTKRAFQIIIDMMKNKKISDFQAFFISATAMTSLSDPTVIPEIADFVTEVSLTMEPFVGSTVLINFAKMVHQFCVVQTATTDYYGGAAFGDEGCNLNYLEEKFLPHLVNIISDEDKTWERIVAIKALHRLAISSTIDILGPIALGQKGSNEQVRTAAIYAFSRWTLPWSTRNHAMQILSEIYTNIGEIPRIRAAALIMYSSWGPEPSFFYRLATLSWSEPSMAMASFYHSLIKAFADANHPIFIKQNQAATHALKLVQPSVSMMKYPGFNREFKFALEEHISKIEEVGLFHFPYPEKHINFDAYSFIMNSMNGFHGTVSELLVTSGGIGEFVKNTFAKYDSKDRNIINTEKIYDDIQAILQSEPTSKREPLMTVYWRLFENIQFLLPITKETLKASQFTDPIYLGSLLLELQTGLSRSLGKFFTLVSFKEFYPNEMGLPIFTGYSGHIAFADTFNARLSVSTSSMTVAPKKVHVFVEDYFKIFSKISGEVNVFVPWSNSRIMTTVKSTRGGSCPTLTTINVDLTSASKPNLQIGIESAYDNKHLILKAKTVPEIGCVPLTVTDQSIEPQMIILSKHKNINKVVPIPQAYTGLAYTLTWDAQFRYPFDLYGFSNLFKGKTSKSEASSEISHLLSSYTAQYWSAEIHFDPQQSETKNITLGLTLQMDTGDKGNQNEEIYQTSGQTEYGQNPWDYSQQGQEQFNYNEYTDHVEQFEGTNPDAVNIHDNFKQKCEKIEKHYGSKASTIELSLGYYGRKNREYEMLFSWTKPHVVNKRRSSKGQLALLRSPIPGVDNKPASVCIDSQIVAPVISSMSTLDSIFKTNLDVEISRSVTPYCRGKPAVNIETKVKLSPKRIEKLRQEIHTDPTYSVYDPVHAFYNVVYDEVRSKITWEDVCNKKGLPILSAAINVLDNTFHKGFYSFDCDRKESSNQLDLDLHRCTETDLWYLQAKRDSYSLEVDAVPTNCFMDFLLSVGVFQAQTLKDLKMSQQPLDKCIIKETSVRTFDGVVFDYKPTTCWTLATKDCANDKFMVFVRECPNGTPVPETRIIDRENGIVIHSGEIQYRGTPKESVVKVHKGEGRNYVVELPNRVKVTVTDSVKIEAMTADVCGICGIKDHEKILEFVGPKQCIFNDAELFFKSWTVPSDLCDVFHVNEIHEEVYDYQENCPTTYDFFKKSPQYQPIHTKYGYVVKEIGNMQCLSYDSLPYCPHGFFSVNPNIIHASFECWYKDSAPEEISSALATGQNRIYSPIPYQPSSVEISLANIDVLCLRTQK